MASNIRPNYVLAVCLGIAALPGCTSYYQVTDPTSGKQYYTTDVKQKNGATMLKDGKTGSRVTIQNSEVTSITKEEFESGKVR